MFTPPPNMVTVFIPTLIGEGWSQGANAPISPERLMMFVNKAYQDFTNWGAQAFRPEIVTYLNGQIEDVSSGRLDISYPDNAAKLVCVSCGIGATPQSEEMTVAMTYPQAGVTYGNNSSNIRARIDPEGRVFVTPGASFGSTPAQVGSTNYIRLWVSKVIPSLHYGITGSGQTSSSSLLTLNTVSMTGTVDYPLSRYVGSRVFIYSGPGAGQSARIASISGNVATCVGVNDPDDDEPFATAITSASYYTIMPWFPDNFLSTLATYAAAQIPKLEAARMLPTVAQDLETFKSWLNAVDMANGKPVNRSFANDMGIAPGTGMAGSYGVVNGGWW